MKWGRYSDWGYDGQSEDILYEKMKSGWSKSSTETDCGSGSEKRNTKKVTQHLKYIVEKYNIITLSDAGAGDLNWFPDGLGVLYQGYDLYPRHEAVKKFDIIKDVLEPSDLILCRHVLNHLSMEFTEKSINNFILSGSKYLLITNCKNQRDYWNSFNYKIPGPSNLIETFDDCHHWDLEFG